MPAPSGAGAVLFWCSVLVLLGRRSPPSSCRSLCPLTSQRICIVRLGHFEVLSQSHRTEYSFLLSHTSSVFLDFVPNVLDIRSALVQSIRSSPVTSCHSVCGSHSTIVLFAFGLPTASLVVVRLHQLRILKLLTRKLHERNFVTCRDFHSREGEPRESLTQTRA